LGGEDGFALENVGWTAWQKETLSEK
jgi:hypothetical protein